MYNVIFINPWRKTHMWRLSEVLNLHDLICLLLKTTKYLKKKAQKLGADLYTKIFKPVERNRVLFFPLLFSG